MIFSQRARKTSVVGWGRGENPFFMSRKHWLKKLPGELAGPKSEDAGSREVMHFLGQGGKALRALTESGKESRLGGWGWIRTHWEL